MWWLLGWRYYGAFALMALGLLAIFNAITLYWRPRQRKVPVTIGWRVLAASIGVASVITGLMLLRVDAWVRAWVRGY